MKIIKKYLHSFQLVPDSLYTRVTVTEDAIGKRSDRRRSKNTLERRKKKITYEVSTRVIVLGSHQHK